MIPLSWKTFFPFLCLENHIYPSGPTWKVLLSFFNFFFHFLILRCHKPLGTKKHVYYFSYDASHFVLCLYFLVNVSTPSPSFHIFKIESRNCTLFICLFVIITLVSGYRWGSENAYWMKETSTIDFLIYSNSILLCTVYLKDMIQKQRKSQFLQ